MDTKTAYSNGGVLSSRLRAQFTNQVSPIPSVLPWEGWTSCLQQLPPFNYGCLYTHLATYSKTIAEKQWSTAAATFGAGAMKHKEEGYCLFPDDHVHMVVFPPDFATDNHSLFRGIVKPSFKTTGRYSTVVALSKISGYVLGAQCNSKAGAGGCCKHVAALPYNILSYVAVVLAIIPVDIFVLTPRNIGIGQEITQVMVQFCSTIQFVYHSYERRKAEVATDQLERCKKYHASPAVLSEEHIRHLYLSGIT